MKILICARSFFPSVGGIEEVWRTLAEELAWRAHGVKVVTWSRGEGATGFPFEIVRLSSVRRLLPMMEWCDVFLQRQIGIRAAWSLGVIRRLWVAVHQTWLTGAGCLARKGRPKGLLLPVATSISASGALAASLSISSTVMPNTYDDSVPREVRGVPRDKDFIFVARLAWDNGAHVAIQALERPKGLGCAVGLTVIGGGPEESGLRKLAHGIGVPSQVDFAGVNSGDELASMLRWRLVMVVPLSWREPFGIVPLEGIACGLVVAVGSDGGGLPEAISPCGVTFLTGDVVVLTQVLAGLLRDPYRVRAYRRCAARHLPQFRHGLVAERYLRVLEAAAGTVADAPANGDQRNFTLGASRAEAAR